LIVFAFAGDSTMRRVLDIEFFLVRLPASSATLVPAPRLLLE